MKIIMPPTLKKLMGHIAFGACVTLFVPTVTFKPLKLVLKFHMMIPHEKIADPYFFSFPSYLPFWSYSPLKFFEKNLVSRISRKVFKLEA